jgi:hypothetical protein
MKIISALAAALLFSASIVPALSRGHGYSHTDRSYGSLTTTQTLAGTASTRPCSARVGLPGRQRVALMGHGVSANMREVHARIMAECDR